MKRMNSSPALKCLICGTQATFQCTYCSSLFCTKECEINNKSSHRKICDPNASFEKFYGDCIWQETEMPPNFTYFSAIIQHIEEVKNDCIIAWVIQKKCLGQLNNLLRITHRVNCAKSLVQPIESLRVDMLVMARYLDGSYQRARVLEILPDKIVVQFIDFGETRLVARASLLKPMPQMESTKALAFNVKLPISGKQLAKGDTISIQIKNNNKTAEGYFIATFDNLNEIMHFPVINAEIKIQIVNLLDSGRKALIRLLHRECASELILPKSEEDEKYLLLTEPSANDCFVLAHFQGAWHRAYLLQYANDNDMPNLVYFIDLGIIRFSQKLRLMPATMRAFSMSVYLVTPSDPLQNFPEVIMRAFSENTEISLHLANSSSNNEIGDCSDGFACSLHIGAAKICDAVAHAFLGKLEEFGIKQWNETIPENTSVLIKQVISHETIAIAPRWSKNYAKWFAKMAPKCKIYTEPDSISDQDMLLAYDDNKNQYFRAKLSTDVTGINGDFVDVIDIDSGDVCSIKCNTIRMPNRAVLSCPVFLTQIHLNDLESIREMEVKNSILSELQNYRDTAFVFVVSYVPKGNAELLYVSNRNHSLSMELSLLQEKGTECTNNLITEQSTNNDDDVSDVKGEVKLSSTSCQQVIEEEEFIRNLQSKLIKHNHDEDSNVQDKTNTKTPSYQEFQEGVDQLAATASWITINDDSNVLSKAKLHSSSCEPVYRDKSSPNSTESTSPPLKKGIATLLNIYRVSRSGSSKEESDLIDSLCEEISRLELSSSTPKSIKHSNELTAGHANSCQISLKDKEIAEDIFHKSASVKVYTIDDLRVFDISEGEKVPILILDSSRLLDNGTVMAADNKNGLGSKRVAKTIIKVAEYVHKAEYVKGYEPNENELCLAIFNKDKQWYRAECLENNLQSDYITVQFVDFGNIAKISKSKLLQLPEQLLFPSPANVCRIKGLDKAELRGLQALGIENKNLECSVSFNLKDQIYDICLH